MAIGILALTFGGLFIAVSAMGIGKVEPPVKADKPVNYPFPKELA